jgi:hypothetical protein
MNEQYVDNRVYTFEPIIALEMDYINVPVDFDVSQKYVDHNDLYADEREVERQYFTKERLEQLENKLLKQIKETAPEDIFNIICRDTDSGWNYTREQLFDLK